MPGCNVKSGTAHECEGRWDCGHGNIFPTHEPNGDFFSGFAHCEECRRECGRDQAKLDSVAGQLEVAIEDLNAYFRQKGDA